MKTNFKKQLKPVKKSGGGDNMGFTTAFPIDEDGKAKLAERE